MRDKRWLLLEDLKLISLGHSQLMSVVSVNKLEGVGMLQWDKQEVDQIHSAPERYLELSWESDLSCFLFHHILEQ